jgi:putative addiction module component (TIGR02574 family)
MSNRYNPNMQASVLTTEALKLSPRQKAKLAEQLLSSLDDVDRKRLDEEWAIEVESRIDARMAGKGRTMPLDKVLKKLERRKHK